MRLGSHMTDEQCARNAATHMGHKETPETRAKISAAHKGRPMSVEARAHMSAAGKLRTESSEQRAKMSAAMKGKPGHPQSPEARAKISVARTGVPHPVSLGVRARISAAHTGPLSSQWKGGPPVWMRKHNAKRRILGFVPLNEPFAGCEAHHVDDEQVINMPAKLHRSIRHNQYTGQGMAQINVVAYSFLFKQEVEAVMTEVSK